MTNEALTPASPFTTYGPGSPPARGVLVSKLCNLG